MKKVKKLIFTLAVLGAFAIVFQGCGKKKQKDEKKEVAETSEKQKAHENSEQIVEEKKEDSNSNVKEEEHDDTHEGKVEFDGQNEG